MKRVIAFLALLLLAAARGSAAEPTGGTVDGNAPIRMEELEVWGDVPIRMEEMEVRGLREKPEVLYIPVHRGTTPPSPARYDLFLEDMTRPVIPDPEGAVRER